MLVSINFIILLANLYNYKKQFLVTPATYFSCIVIEKFKWGTFKKQPCHTSYLCAVYCTPLSTFHSHQRGVGSSTLGHGVDYWELEVALDLDHFQMNPPVRVIMIQG